MRLEFVALRQSSLKLIGILHNLAAMLLRLVLRMEVNHLWEWLISNRLNRGLVDVQNLQIGAVECLLVDFVWHGFS